MNEQDALNYRVDRTGWLLGEWDSEPDRVDFQHVGYACLMLRNEGSGAWCGYVGVPTGHVAFEKSWDDGLIDVHGGLTYSGECRPPICHVPAPGMPERVLWLGFDCAHYNDYCPAMHAREIKLRIAPRKKFGTYRTLAYVRREVERLAEQLESADLTTKKEGAA